MKKWIVILVVIAAVAGIGGYAYWNYRRAQAMLHPKFYSGNGRLEATEIYVSSKLAGRIEKIFVKEGDLVKKGDKLVQMQTNTLEAEKAATLANIKVQEGELAMARTAPGRGSSTTMEPVYPCSACSAATWMRESMVRTTELPGWATPARERMAFSQLE